MPLGPGVPRFLKLTDVAEILNISATQAYALVRREELKAVKIGGRGVWRIEASELEAYIQRSYAETQEFIDGHPFGEIPDDDETADISSDGAENPASRADH